MQSLTGFVAYFQQSAEKLCKQLESQLSEVNSKLDDTQRNITEMGSQKGRAQSENAELSRQLEEAESQVNALTKAKQALSKSLEECKANLEEESRGRSKLQGEVRNLQADCDQLRDQLEEEQEGRGDAQRMLTKANNEIAEWRRKFESGEGGVRSEELDDLKRKMQAKLNDVESQLEAALSKCGSMEKARNRLQGELEDVMIEMERAQAMASQAEKRQRAFDKTVDEWKRKVSDLQHELDNANAESRGNAAEVFKLRAQLDESHDSIEALRRENKNLSGQYIAY